LSKSSIIYALSFMNILVGHEITISFFSETSKSSVKGFGFGHGNCTIFVKSFLAKWKKALIFHDIMKSAL